MFLIPFQAHDSFTGNAKNDINCTKNKNNNNLKLEKSTVY